MALTGRKLQHGRTSVSGEAPDAGQMLDGQIFINTADEVLYIKNSSGVIVGFQRNGGGGGVPDTIEQTITSAGANTINVPNPMNSDGHSLFINGLAQSSASYSLSGQTVILPSTLSLMVGDVVIFNYFRSE
jgi:hypothetical protein